MMLQTAVFSILFCSVSSFAIQGSRGGWSRSRVALGEGGIHPGQAGFEKSEEHSGNTIDEDDFSISTLLEKANKNVGKDFDEPLVIDGDIAVPAGLMNADPCTNRTRFSCKWPKASDGNVYVPFRISNQYSRRERDIIIRGLRSFSESTCIRFTPLNRQRDFVDIQSLSGCFSFVGRRGNSQVVSLSRQGCVFQQVIQHELLHALGFNHEQTRSDRDEHVVIQLQNVIRGLENNFRKINNSVNLDTPYDYNSVMHYGRFDFSRNGQPTIVPIPDPNVAIGRATEMSPIDILRVNRLYECNVSASKLDPAPVQRHHFH